MSGKEEAVWDRFSGLYDHFMHADEEVYREMIERIRQRVAPYSDVLEVATGTGIVALELTGRNCRIEAVDFSPKMIALAKQKARKAGVSDISFSVQNAMSLKFDSDPFDFAVIANALHIMSEPEKTLEEIRRVLRPDGKLIASTFLHAGSKKNAVLSKLMELTGFRAYRKWTPQTYVAFLERNGFTVRDFVVLNASFPLAYAVAQSGSGFERNSVKEQRE